MLPDAVRESAQGTLLEPKALTEAVMYALATPPEVNIHEVIVRRVGELLRSI